MKKTNPTISLALGFSFLAAGLSWAQGTGAPVTSPNTDSSAGITGSGDPVGSPDIGRNSLPSDQDIGNPTLGTDLPLGSSDNTVSTCIDSTGTTVRRGDAGFETCIRNRRNQLGRSTEDLTLPQIPNPSFDQPPPAGEAGIMGDEPESVTPAPGVPDSTGTTR